MTGAAPRPTESPADGADRPERLSRLAERVALGAGELIRRARAEAVDAAGGGLASETKSTATDLVTAVDKASERYIVEQLRAARPGDGLLGEEGTDEPGSTGVRWVIDPIDGTVNFVLGLPHYSVSIAAVQDGRTIAACVLDVAGGDCYRAAAGGGAWLGDRRLGGPRPVPVAEMVVGTGFTYQAHERARQGQVLAAVLPQVANLRRLGSAALDLCLVGAGQLDAFYEFGINEWDVAAGLLVAQEAGAVASGLRGRPAAAPFVAAAGPAHAAEFFALLEAADADRIG